MIRRQSPPESLIAIFQTIGSTRIVVTADALERPEGRRLLPAALECNLNSGRVPNTSSLALMASYFLTPQ